VGDRFAIGDLRPESVDGLVSAGVEQGDCTSGVALIFIGWRVLACGNSLDQTGFAEAEEGETRASFALGRWAGGV
jgi:hypothetical protein